MATFDPREHELQRARALVEFLEAAGEQLRSDGPADPEIADELRKHIKIAEIAARQWSLQVALASGVVELPDIVDFNEDEDPGTIN